MGGSDVYATEYKPTDQEMSGYKITIEKKTKKVNIDLSYEDNIKLY
jgi:hypothetical protein